MSTAYIGQIRIFGGVFAPRDHSLCNGQTIAITQYTALFSLIGTTYGGDGRTSFGLPEMRGRIAIHAGQGPGLSDRPLGSRGGVGEVALSTSQLPSHRHAFYATQTTADSQLIASRMIAPDGDNDFALPETTDVVTFNEKSLEAAGGNTPTHTNLAPYLGVNYIIAMAGIFPPRN